jgi:tRNA-specific 2-thiouridylase
MERFVGNAAAGAEIAWVELGVERGRIRWARGGGESMPSLLEHLPGLTPLEAAAVPGERLAVDALHDALGPSVRAPRDPERALVAMSGGVDSAVALLKARAAGFRPVGVTLRLWTDPAGPHAERACCSPSAVVSARETCHRLGLPHVTLDLRDGFRAAVVAPFVSGYSSGTTPNPCVRCNGSFRFRELLAFASRVGAARLVTGHYARLAQHRGRLLLARAADAAKDQSYMLATLDPAILPRLWLPLGDQSKDETRTEARVAGLEAAARPESQEACFLAGSDYRDFLERHGLEPRPGPILDEQGRELGRHSGFWRFTPGQRRGLGVAAGLPVYTVGTDAVRNAVVVGPRASLARRRISVSPGRLHVQPERVEAKLRYRSAAVPARVVAAARGFSVELDEPAYGVAAGQTAVLYEDGAVVGAGTISSAR